MAGTPAETPADHLFRLDGRVAFIAGGSGAIGSAIGEALGRWGASIAVAGRTAQRVKEVAGKLEHSAVASLGVIGDVTKKADCERMVADCSGVRGSRFTRLYRARAQSGRQPRRRSE